MTAMPQALVLSRASPATPATEIAVTSRNHATAPNYVSIWDPESVGTHFRNGSIRLAIDGLSLNHTW
ncbi:unnamed protein product [Prunus armeniaca]|uniref:Uncharacterized protein n=1 Tax=Prunus armeniaca TaxID=36596 RepID=A0A6J5TKB0_PRUAR|nr:unnamed protein product [Prunus armeniaca]